MEPEEKEALKRCISKLSNELVDTEVLEHLRIEGIISSQEMSKIMSKKTKRARCHELIRTIEDSKPSCFNFFIKILRETYQTELADCLTTSLRQILERTCPPTFTSMSAELQSNEAQTSESNWNREINFEQLDGEVEVHGIDNSQSIDDPISKIDGELEKCWVFVDSSYLIIELWKYFAQKQKLLTTFDCRAHIDLGHLVDYLIENRTTEGHEKAWLYGPEPPASDMVWKMIEENNVKMHAFKNTGKEKGVDLSLITDAICEAAINKAQGRFGTFIFVVSDRDYIICIKKVLELGYNVEIVCWRSRLSNGFITLAKNQKKLSFRLLDDIVDENPNDICFFNIMRNDMRRLPRKRTIVVEFKTKPNWDEIISNLVETITKQFELPFLIQWKDDTTLYLIVEGTKNRNRARVHEDFDNSSIEDIVQDIDEHSFQLIENEAEYEDQPYDFIKLYKEHYDWLLNFLAKYGDVTKICSAEKYSNVAAEMPPNPNSNQKVERCQLTFFCIKGKECPRKHTLDELRYFELVPNAGERRFYKTKPCFKGVLCRFIKDTQLCSFAHDIGEARCLLCQKIGEHFAYDCPTDMHKSGRRRLENPERREWHSTPI